MKTYNNCIDSPTGHNISWQSEPLVISAVDIFDEFVDTRAVTLRC